MAMLCCVDQYEAGLSQENDMCYCSFGSQEKELGIKSPLSPRHAGLRLCAACVAACALDSNCSICHKTAGFSLKLYSSSQICWRLMLKTYVFNKQMGAFKQQRPVESATCWTGSEPFVLT